MIKVHFSRKIYHLHLSNRYCDEWTSLGRCEAFTKLETELDNYSTVDASAESSSNSEGATTTNGNIRDLVSILKSFLTFCSLADFDFYQKIHFSIWFTKMQTETLSYRKLRLLFCIPIVISRVFFGWEIVRILREGQTLKIL